MRRIKLKIKNIVLLLLVIVFIFSISRVVLYCVDLRKNTKDSKTLIQKVVNIEVDVETKEEAVKIDFDYLMSINSDTVGWIQFNQDKVNNPIVQASDNSYYLDHSFNTEYNQVGTIFMDYRNASFDDKNVVLFGHAMLDDTMFGSIEDIFDDNFFDIEENHYIQIYDANNELLTYRIFSYYIIEKEEYYITTSFTSDDEFYSFLDTILKRSYKNFDVDVATSDHILTLSTCHGTGNTTKRKVVHAKRVGNV